MKKQLFVAGILATAMTIMTSCSDDEGGLDPNLPLYQQYRVEQMMWNNTTSAFANFEASQNGKTVRVMLDNGASVRANNTTMSYYKSDTSDPYSFDYTADIFTPSDGKVTFTLVRNISTTLTNTIDLSAVPYVIIPDTMTLLKNDERYELPVVGRDLQGDFRIILSENGVFNPVTYEVTNRFFAGDKLYFTLSGIPTGRKYDMRVLCSIKRSLQQNNGAAGGEIVGCKVSRKLKIEVN